MDKEKEIESLLQTMCDKYCKWPEIWDEDIKEMPLSESEHCKNCPLNKLAEICRRSL